MAQNHKNLELLHCTLAVIMLLPGFRVETAPGARDLACGARKRNLSDADARSTRVFVDRNYGVNEHVMAAQWIRAAFGAGRNAGLFPRNVLRGAAPPARPRRPSVPPQRATIPYRTKTAAWHLSAPETTHTDGPTGGLATRMAMLQPPGYVAFHLLLSTGHISMLRLACKMN